MKIEVCLLPWKWKDKQGGGAILQGIGTITLGVAAIIASCQTSNVVDKIFEVREQAKQITVGVEELKASSKSLDIQIKALASRQIIGASPALQSKNNVTISEAKDAIKHIPTQASGSASIYLPLDKVDETVKELVKEKTPAARAQILQNNLVIEKPESTIQLKDKDHESN